MPRDRARAFKRLSLTHPPTNELSKNSAISVKRKIDTPVLKSAKNLSSICCLAKYRTDGRPNRVARPAPDQEATKSPALTKPRARPIKLPIKRTISAPMSKRFIDRFSSIINLQLFVHGLEVRYGRFRA